MVFGRTRRLLVSIAVATAVLATAGAADALAALGSGAALAGHPPIGALDAVTYDASTDTIAARGWAGDQDGSATTQRVHLYVDGRGFLAISTGRSRPDVARHYPALGTTTGFSVRTQAPAGQGNHQVCAYAINQGGGPATMIGCRTVFFAGTMVGHIDKATNLYGEQVDVYGWALDPHVVSPPAQPLRVFAAQKGLGTIKVQDDLDYLTVLTTGDRPDVDRHYPNNGSHHGFHWSAESRNLYGSHQPTSVCLYRLLGPSTPGLVLFQETAICSAVTFIPPGN